MDRDNTGGDDAEDKDREERSASTRKREEVTGLSGRGARPKSRNQTTAARKEDRIQTSIVPFNRDAEPLEPHQYQLRQESEHSPEQPAFPFHIQGFRPSQYHVNRHYRPILIPVVPVYLQDESYGPDLSPIIPIIVDPNDDPVLQRFYGGLQTNPNQAGISGEVSHEVYSANDGESGRIDLRPAPRRIDSKGVTYFQTLGVKPMPLTSRSNCDSAFVTPVLTSTSLNIQSRVMHGRPIVRTYGEAPTVLAQGVVPWPTPLETTGFNQWNAVFRGQHSVPTPVTGPVYNPRQVVTAGRGYYPCYTAGPSSHPRCSTIPVQNTRYHQAPVRYPRLQYNQILPNPVRLGDVSRARISKQSSISLATQVQTSSGPRYVRAGTRVPNDSLLDNRHPTRARQPSALSTTTLPHCSWSRTVHFGPPLQIRLTRNSHVNETARNSIQMPQQLQPQPRTDIVSLRPPKPAITTWNQPIAITESQYPILFPLQLRPRSRLCGDYSEFQSSAEVANMPASTRTERAERAFSGSVVATCTQMQYPPNAREHEILPGQHVEDEAHHQVTVEPFESLVADFRQPPLSPQVHRRSLDKPVLNRSRRSSSVSRLPVPCEQPKRASQRVDSRFNIRNLRSSVNIFKKSPEDSQKVCTAGNQQKITSKETPDKTSRNRLSRLWSGISYKGWRRSKSYSLSAPEESSSGKDIQAISDSQASSSRGGQAVGRMRKSCQSEEVERRLSSTHSSEPNRGSNITDLKALSTAVVESWNTSPRRRGKWLKKTEGTSTSISSSGTKIVKGPATTYLSELSRSSENWKRDADDPSHPEIRKPDPKQIPTSQTKRKFPSAMTFRRKVSSVTPSGNQGAKRETTALPRSTGKADYPPSHKLSTDDTAACSATTKPMKTTKHFHAKTRPKSHSGENHRNISSSTCFRPSQTAGVQRTISPPMTESAETLLERLKEPVTTDMSLPSYLAAPMAFITHRRSSFPISVANQPSVGARAKSLTRSRQMHASQWPNKVEKNANMRAEPSRNCERRQPSMGVSKTHDTKSNRTSPATATSELSSIRNNSNLRTEETYARQSSGGFPELQGLHASGKHLPAKKSESERVACVAGRPACPVYAQIEEIANAHLSPTSRLPAPSVISEIDGSKNYENPELAGIGQFAHPTTKDRQSTGTRSSHNFTYVEWARQAPEKAQTLENTFHLQKTKRTTQVPSNGSMFHKIYEALWSHSKTHKSKSCTETPKTPEVCSSETDSTHDFQRSVSDVRRKVRIKSRDRVASFQAPESSSSSSWLSEAASRRKSRTRAKKKTSGLSGEPPFPRTSVSQAVGDAQRTEVFRFTPTSFETTVIPRLQGEGCGGFAMIDRRWSPNVVRSHVALQHGDRGYRQRVARRMAYGSFIRSNFVTANEFMVAYHDIAEVEFDALLFQIETRMYMSHPAIVSNVLQFLDMVLRRPEISHLELERCCQLLRAQNRPLAGAVLCYTACVRYCNAVINDDWLCAHMFCHFAEIAFQLLRDTRPAPPVKAFALMLSDVIFAKTKEFTQAFPGRKDRIDRTTQQTSEGLGIYIEKCEGEMI